MTTATPTERIVIASGQEFRVPLDIEIEAVRQHLAQNFPEVSSATIKKGKKTIEGTEYETVEFVKQAGTKGLSGSDLARLIALAPRQNIPKRPKPLSRDLAISQRLMPLRHGTLTVDQVLAQREVFDAALDEAQRVWRQPHAMPEEGATLCNRIERLAPVAAPITPHGW